MKLLAGTARAGPAQHRLTEVQGSRVGRLLNRKTDYRRSTKVQGNRVGRHSLPAPNRSTDYRLTEVQGDRVGRPEHPVPRRHHLLHHHSVWRATRGSTARSPGTRYERHTVRSSSGHQPLTTLMGIECAVLPLLHALFRATFVSRSACVGGHNFDPNSTRIRH